MKKILLPLVILIPIIQATGQPTRSTGNSQTPKNNVVTSATIQDVVLDNITFYPNPVVDILRVSFRSNSTATVEISLFNNIGKQVYTQMSAAETGNNTISIDVRSKAIVPGIYFIKLKSESDSFTRKLIVK